MENEHRRRVFLRGVSATTATKLVGGGLALLMQVILARMLGAEDYGVYIYAFSWLTLLALASRLGMDTGLMRYCAQYRDAQAWPQLRGIVTWALRNVVVSSLIVALVTTLILLGWSHFEPSRQGLVLLAALPAVPFLAVSLARQGALRGLGHPALAELPDSLLRPTLIVIMVLIAWHSGLAIDSTSAMIFTVIAYAIAFVAGIALLWYLIPAKSRHVAGIESPSEWWKLSIPLIVMQGAQIVMERLDILMLGPIAGPEVTGIYAVSARLAALAAFGLAAMNPVVAPRLSAAFHGKRPGEFAWTVRFSRRIGLAVVLPLATILMIFGRELLGIFGTAFVAGYAPLLILVGGQVVNAGAGPAGYVLAMTGLQKTAATYFVAALLVNAALNALLIPDFGSVGAAVATATSLAAWNIAMFVACTSLADRHHREA